MIGVTVCNRHFGLTQKKDSPIRIAESLLVSKKYYTMGGAYETRTHHLDTASVAL